MKAIQHILDSQLKFQNRMGYDFSKMSLKEKAKYIKEQMLWATDELHEMIHEVPYAKDWSKKYYDWSDEKMNKQILLTKEEYIDFLHFAFNIALALGMNEEDIIRMYNEKNKINNERQNTGY